MANDIEEFEAQFGATEFAGASVTAKAPGKTYVDSAPTAGTVIPELSTKGTGFGDITPQTPLGSGSQPEVIGDINATVDAEIDILGNSGDIDEFESFISSPTTSEYKPSTTSASFTGGDKGASDFTKAIAGSILGSKQFFLDILDGISFEPTSEMSQENLAKIQHIKSMVQDDSLFSSYGMGQAVYSIATLPIAARRIATTALAEAYMGYSISRGSGAEVGPSIASGVAAGTITYGVGKLLNNLGGTTALEAIEGSVGRKMDLSTVYSDFARLTNRKVEDLTNHDKVLAIASAGGKETAQIFKEMALRNHADGRAIDDYLQKPIDGLKEKVAANSLAKTKEALQGQIVFAKSAYNELENLAMVYPTANINLGPAKQSIIDNILTSTNEITRSPKLNKALTTLQKENINLEELLDLRKDLNGVKFKAQNLNSKTRNEVDAVNYIDSVIDKNLPAEFKPAFTALREELAMAYSFAGKQKKVEYKNKIAELVTKIDSGEETAIAVLQKLVKASGGPNKFNQIHRGIGTEEAINFEKSLIKEIMAAKGDKLAEVIKVTNGLGFITPEAKALVQNIQDIDKVFSSADFYRATLSEIHHGGLDGTSITNDVTTKFSYMATAGVWKVLRPYLDPISQTARSEREFRRIIDSIRKGIKADTSKTKLDGPTEEMYSVFRPIIRESIVGTIQDTLNTIRGMSGARVPEGQATNLLDAPADFTVRADGIAIRQSGDAAQDALSREPINTTIVDETNVPSTSVKPSEEIIDVEWWNPTSTVITPDGHILSMEELLRAESLPDNMRLPEKASAPIKNFFDMKYKMKTDPDLIKAREEVKKAKTAPDKEKAKGRLVKLLEYQRLREQGMKPADANRLAMQSSSEVGGALAGGTINGVTIDDDGNLQVDPEAFLIGAAGGAAVVKGGKQLGKQLSNSIPKDAIIKENVTLYHGTPAEFKAKDARLNPGKSGKGFYTYTTDDKLQAARSGSPREKYKSKNIMKVQADKLVIKKYDSNAQAIRDNKDGKLQKLGYNAMQIKDEIIILDPSILRDVSRY